MSRYRKPLSLRPEPGGTPITTAMVMAAGIGKRMRPLTATRPKPLIEVAGKPLIDHVFNHLREGGIMRAVVNVHYLADAVEAHLKSRVKDIDVVISDERGKLLETGGGLMKAASLLGDKPFLVVNSDNYWVDGPVDAIKLLGGRWEDDLMDVLMLVVPQARANCHGGQGDFHMDPSGRLSRRKPNKVAPFVYTGVQLMSPRLLKDAPQDIFSTNILWDRAIAAARAYGVVHQGLWFDVGTPRAITRTEFLLTHG